MGLRPQLSAEHRHARCEGALRQRCIAASQPAKRAAKERGVWNRQRECSDEGSLRCWRSTLSNGTLRLLRS